MSNQEVIRRNLTIIALDILIKEFSNALEEEGLTPNEKDFLITCIEESKIYIEELMKDLDAPQTIKRPIWKQLT